MSELPFLQSATSALDFFSSLWRLSSLHAQREGMPSTLEMLTVCRETGCKLTDLECYARAVDSEGVVLLCGGSPELAATTARRLGFEVDFFEITELPLMWRVQGGGDPEMHFRHGLTETRLTPEVLKNLLSKKLGQERLITIRQRVNSDSDSIFVWIPDPGYFEKFLDDPVVFELMLSQRCSFIIDETAPESILLRLREMGQYLAVLSVEHHSPPVMLAMIEELLTSFHESDSDARDVKATTMWSWLVPRLIESTERTKQQYDLQIGKQKHKLSATVQLLREYRRNWVAGIKNQADAYLQKKTTGKSFESFYDAKQSGPEIESFLNAVGIGTLKQKLVKSMTDRMAEFVSGLSALATKVELRRIALRDVETRWNPAKVNSLIEAALIKNKVFTEGGGAKAGLVGSLTGKSEEIIKTRKGQIARGCRFVSQAFETEFATWCDELMKQVEKQVQIQLAANLVDQGLPESDTLKTAMEGLDRLAAMIQGDAQSQMNSPDAIVANWLHGMASRRLIPAYVPAA